MGVVESHFIEAQGKSKMVALGGAMRKLQHIIYGVLKSGKPFNPGLHLRVTLIELTVQPGYKYTIDHVVKPRTPSSILNGSKGSRPLWMIVVALPECIF